MMAVVVLPWNLGDIDVSGFWLEIFVSGRHLRTFCLRVQRTFFNRVGSGKVNLDAVHRFCRDSPFSAHPSAPNMTADSLFSPWRFGFLRGLWSLTNKFI